MKLKVINNSVNIKTNCVRISSRKMAITGIQVISSIPPILKGMCLFGGKDEDTMTKTAKE